MPALDGVKLCLLRQKGKRSTELEVDLVDILSATTFFGLLVKRIPSVKFSKSFSRCLKYYATAKCRSECQHCRES